MNKAKLGLTLIVYIIAVVTIYNVLIIAISPYYKPVDKIGRMYNHNLGYLAIAFEEYANDHIGFFPQDLRELFPKYVNDPLVFWAPRDRNNRPPRTISNSNIDGENSSQTSYIYNPSIRLREKEDKIIIRENNGAGYILKTNWQIERRSTYKEKGEK